jgi:hypothetical protein
LKDGESPSQRLRANYAIAVTNALAVRGRHLSEETGWAVIRGLSLNRRTGIGPRGIRRAISSLFSPPAASSLRRVRILYQILAEARAAAKRAARLPCPAPASVPALAVGKSGFLLIVDFRNTTGRATVAKKYGDAWIENAVREANCRRPALLGHRHPY